MKMATLSSTFIRLCTGGGPQRGESILRWVSIHSEGFPLSLLFRVPRPLCLHYKSIVLLLCAVGLGYRVGVAGYVETTS